MKFNKYKVTFQNQFSLFEKNQSLSKESLFNYKNKKEVYVKI